MELRSPVKHHRKYYGRHITEMHPEKETIPIETGMETSAPITKKGG